MSNMRTNSLATMSIAELRYERHLAKAQLAIIKVSMRGTATKERMELEEAAEEAREYIEIIERRIARLERQNRPQP